MEAYIALVQETKNTRLKYLLAQTDEYIATIRNMIRDQRQVPPPSSRSIDHSFTGWQCSPYHRA
jgi:hypothetical protein